MRGLPLETAVPEHARNGAAAPGAYLLGVPDSVDPQPNNGTFWKSLPGGPGLFWPMFIVALLAAIVASQALISAVFQIAYQAIAQGFFPRFHVYHTSRKHKGQVWKALARSPSVAMCPSTAAATRTPLLHASFQSQVYCPSVFEHACIPFASHACPW